MDPSTITLAVVEYVTLLGLAKPVRRASCCAYKSSPRLALIPVFLDLSAFAEETRKDAWTTVTSQRLSHRQFRRRVRKIGTDALADVESITDGIAFMRCLTARCAATEGDTPVLLMVDEIGTVPADLVWIRSFRNIRAAYNSSVADHGKPFRRITFIFAGNVLNRHFDSR
jgi:hypothetical protein